MRNKNELLDICIEHIDIINKKNGIFNYNTGLCGLIGYLYVKQNIITEDENIFLKDLFYENIKKSSFIYFLNPNTKSIYNTYGGYFWEPGSIKPRLRYLKYLKTL